MKKEKLFCPNCKSCDIEDNSPRENNGVIGNGFRSWKISESRKCNNCGNIFDPDNKISKQLQKEHFSKKKKGEKLNIDVRILDYVSKWNESDGFSTIQNTYGTKKIKDLKDPKAIAWLFQRAFNTDLEKIKP